MIRMRQENPSFKHKPAAFQLVTRHLHWTWSISTSLRSENTAQ